MSTGVREGLITKTGPYNIQRFFSAIKIEKFHEEKKNQIF